MLPNSLNPVEPFLCKIQEVQNKKRTNNNSTFPASLKACCPQWPTMCALFSRVNFFSMHPNIMAPTPGPRSLVMVGLHVRLTVGCGSRLRQDSVVVAGADRATNTRPSFSRQLVRTSRLLFFFFLSSSAKHDVCHTANCGGTRDASIIKIPAAGVPELSQMTS